MFSDREKDYSLKEEYTDRYFSQVVEVIRELDVKAIERIVDILVETKQSGGRLFLLGVGGSAANCSHAVNDFRKISGIEAYAPTDNISELTARTNDEGWETVFTEWLKISHLSEKDVVFVFSVSGGNLQRNVSVNIVRGLMYAKEVGTKVLGIVSRDGGYTAQVADGVVLIPPKFNEMITPFAESLQALIWHLLANHPKLKTKA